MLPFNPFELQPLATINMRPVIPLEGAEPGWIGRNGWELCGRPAFEGMIRARDRDLGLQDVPDLELPRALNACLASPDDAVRCAAEEVAVERGQRLGCLIASIKLSPRGITNPLLDWESLYLRYWRTETRHIYLGGGLASGRLGEITAEQAEAVLRLNGLGKGTISPAPDAPYLPLIGAARCQPAAGGSSMVVADFGHTRVKLGLARLNPDRALSRLDVLPSQEMKVFDWQAHPAEMMEGMAEILAGAVRQAIETEEALSPVISCSIAAYIRDGQPVRIDRADYARLDYLAPDLTGQVSREVSARAGREARLCFIHDCDSAAVSFAGRPKTAALMMGTAMGIGFAPPARFYRPLAEGFALFIRE